MPVVQAVIIRLRRNDARNSVGNQGHRHRCHSQRLFGARAGEDYIFHPRAAQTLGRLLPQDPTDSVTEVGFSTTVRPDHGSYAAAVKLHFRSVVERLEPMNLDTLKFQQPETPFLRYILGGVSILPGLFGGVKRPYLIELRKASEKQQYIVG